MKQHPMVIVLAFALSTAVGFWLARTMTPEVTLADPADPLPLEVKKTLTAEQPARHLEVAGSAITEKGDANLENTDAHKNERVLAFKDRAAMEDFLKRIGAGVRVQDRLDALNALKVSFGKLEDLLAALNGSEELSMIFPISTPTPKNGTVQNGALPMGSNLLKWLGVSTDNSSWGKGVLIAILDTGVMANSAFSSSIQRINLVDLPSDPSQQNPHATAVASMIIGNDPLTRGVAPGANILSIRIAGDDGYSDTFMLARGIIAAADAGAPLINISMGSFGDSAIVRNALEYATAKGSLVFAATGNNGLHQVCNPAAYQNVIAVGAVDAGDNHLDFSNTGSSVDMAAPGYGLNAAWSENQIAIVTGTSFSTPIVVGAVAALMTEKNLTAAEAWNDLNYYKNDGGPAGPDEQLGGGTPDLGRAMAGDTPGIYDAAVGSTRVIPPNAKNPNGQIEILVQNRGTETLVNTNVQINTGGGVINSNITTLAPTEVTTVSVPIPRTFTTTNRMTVDSRVILSNGLTDIKSSNNRRIESYLFVGKP